MRIVVAMSGGVDSSVAAALLAREGHDVIGLSMQLYDQQQAARRASAAAARSTISTMRGASPAAIGIPHYIVNFERKFEEHVDRRTSSREYAAGRTPIPCVHCNGDLKFAIAASSAPRASTPRRSRPATTRGSSFDDEHAALPAEARRRRGRRISRTSCSR